MDHVDPQGRLHHVVPMYAGMRWFLLGCGLFVIGVSFHELWRGVWPLNFASPFFGLILFGALSVGVPMLLASAFSPTVAWAIAPGRIDITLTDPFRTRTVAVVPSNIDRFDIRERDWDSTGPTWCVVLHLQDGQRYETRDFGSRATAEAFRDRIRSIFEG